MDAYEGIGESLAAVNRINRRLLSAGQLADLEARPLTLHAELAGRSFCLVHAAPSDPLGGYVHEPEIRVRGAGMLDAVGADVLLMGHTHVPYVVKPRRGLVVNPGSVGLPRDEPRASYATLEIHEDGVEARIHRVGYDEGEVVAEMERRGFPEAFVASARARAERGGQPQRADPG